ncbi:MAG: PEP-CTERM sorting domain-containing protein [Telluria sp.]
MSIFDASDALVRDWTFVGPAIGAVGGNRYGWFDFNEFSTLAIDNSEMRTANGQVPEPGTLALLSLGLLGLVFAAISAADNCVYNSARSVSCDLAECRLDAITGRRNPGAIRSHDASTFSYKVENRRFL